MKQADDEDQLLRTAALQNVQSILQARQRAERELVETKEALEEERRILELLNESGAALASKLDLEAVVQSVTDAATELSGAQFGAFFYTQTNPEGDAFTLYTLSGAPREAFAKFGHPRSTPIFSPTFLGQGVVRIANVREDPRYGQWGPHFGMPPGHLPVCSYLAVPVVARSGEVIGGLFFGHRDCNVFSERSERLIVGIAAQAAIAIDNARLYQQATRYAEAERAARAEMERISIIKDEFLATLSHELRTPLNAVLGWSEMLLVRSNTDPEVRRGLETIVRNARAQAQLIEDLLDMNRIVSGKIRLEVERVDFVATVEAAIESVRPSVAAKSLHLRTTIDPNAGPVSGDPNRLQQIVWNLLSNAVKFTPKGGTIDVLVQRVDSQVEVIVHDSGVGISADFLPHLFERFRQADSTSTRKFGGLGLGLSIVKHLVELHGGVIHAESAGEGHGSTFVVSLPVRALRDSTPPRQSSPPRGDVELATDAQDLSLVGLKVLLVDDEPDARELVRNVVEDAGATAFTAKSADEGMALVLMHRPDIIVSDIGMPGRDGYEFIRLVRARSVAEGGRTPAIALTAFARSEDRTRAMIAGFQVHVSKPIQPRELVATIRSLAANRA